jgi:hypothetical protein
MTSGKSVDEVIQSLPRNEQVIVKRLRALILECLPKAKEKLSYGVPFYTGHRMICFIWPPSMYWGPKQKRDKNEEKGVSLGFCQGNLMSNDEGELLTEGRKQVYCMYFKLLKEINDGKIRALLFEAELIDENFKKGRSLKHTSNHGC